MSADTETAMVASAGTESARPREEMEAALQAHELWFGKGIGDPPDLSAVDLRGFPLQRRQLQEARLRGAILEGADLSSTSLRGADLCRAMDLLA